MTTVLRAATTAVLVAALLGCSSAASPDVTKVRDPASIATGMQLFAVNCAPCHGTDLAGGRVPGGGRAPSLATKVGPDDPVLIEIVKRGRGLEMPSFASLLEESAIESIVDYLRHVQAERIDG